MKAGLDVSRITDEGRGYEFDANVTLQKRATPQITGSSVDNYDQKVILLQKSFRQVIQIARYSLKAPGVTQKRRSEIYNNYFFDKDLTLVEKVFRNILGNKVREGSASFTNITISIDVPQTASEECQRGRTLAYVVTPEHKRIQLCPLFWTLAGTYLEHADRLDIGQLRPKCSQIGDFVSEAMTFPALLLLHEIL
ncbi:uncharacterized protein KY384_007648 [Bacidia gigantensis]|uniref:uncharacterized protein n=1 Tax=Bacidia gigantensis TaxID=2732470 RepID=UPI001D050215|nr:uncharacterized protein KY384_007648 [Bacidia gigantensis]KAG8527496.1 hypothetical protein KY384_007648 [Bacidia gigantensis]